LDFHARISSPIPANFLCDNSSGMHVWHG
jgi:hypothetical protein